MANFFSGLPFSEVGRSELQGSRASKIKKIQGFEALDKQKINSNTHAQTDKNMIWKT